MLGAALSSALLRVRPGASRLRPGAVSLLERIPRVHRGSSPRFHASRDMLLPGITDSHRVGALLTVRARRCLQRWFRSRIGGIVTSSDPASTFEPANALLTGHLRHDHFRSKWLGCGHPDRGGEHQRIRIVLAVLIAVGEPDDSPAVHDELAGQQPRVVDEWATLFATALRELLPNLAAVAPEVLW